jgi:large subunit ribosomal protein L31e
MVKAKKAAAAKVKKQPVAREYTIHIHKYVHHVAFKKRAPRALKAVRRFAQKTMGTHDVRIDTNLNKYLWSKGIRNVPVRVRVRLSRRRNEDEDAKSKMYTLVTWVPVATFHGLQTKAVEDE